uniref:Uncharacterized protein n=1 Tax=Spironucleus salmonicida TaxID=348837 RepID=V6LLV4_9EUKA|eukprot:EST44686.1 Hypothetical protein SS50377_ee049 [Spironucleus salmonicida]
MSKVRFPSSTLYRFSKKNFLTISCVSAQQHRFIYATRLPSTPICNYSTEIVIANFSLFRNFSSLKLKFHATISLFAPSRAQNRLFSRKFFPDYRHFRVKKLRQIRHFGAKFAVLCVSSNFFGSKRSENYIKIRQLEYGKLPQNTTFEA